LVGRPSAQVRFTSGATESNAWALRGLAAAARDRGMTQPRILVSAVEHPSVLAWGTDRIPVSATGLVDLDALRDLLGRHQGQVAAVSVMAANNETGVIQPIHSIAELCATAGVPLHCDASQIPGRVPFDLSAPLLTLSAHKMGGPKGVGALVCAKPPPALLRGGAQERGSRSGTVATPLVVGFGVAAERGGLMSTQQRDRLEAACERLGGHVLGKGAPRLPNTCTAIFDAPGDLIVMALDLEGIAASTGSACASGAATDSHVVRAMGLSGVPVRFSLGPMTQVDAAIQALERVLGRIREIGEIGWEPA
ncbi:MAG: aminotransferase class V-fold PLP-dependent enzyme, partial [Oligoflexia bacterium]|nr:aminotransferase class V-fold PLP-dependent enzyme [Oligoflexia bacterium]